MHCMATLSGKSCPSAVCEQCHFFCRVRNLYFQLNLPVFPTRPVDPVIPVGPTPPFDPDGPDAPVPPLGPTAPASPAKPCRPMDPEIKKYLITKTVRDTNTYYQLCAWNCVR